jgi:spore maturation protein A
MVEYIWAFLILIGLSFSILTGNSDVINKTILASAGKSLELLISIIPIVVLWTGIMRIAESSGLLKKFANLLSPILNKLFPSVPKNNPALGYIASNIAANMLGLGSAATPFGLKAMEELQKINDNKKVASTAMITFLVLNTAGVTIIPTTVLSMRVASNSIDPTIIILPSVIATTCSSVGGLILDYLYRRRK